MTLGLRRLNADAAPVPRLINIIQGEHRISDNPAVVLTTILGSCVAACIRDPVSGVGGMNHFLLPGDGAGPVSGDPERYGVHAMELLVNALLKSGAQRRNLEIKLFGGAKTMSGLADIGAQNAAFALRFAERERLTIAGTCLGGERGRRLQYAPVSGRARRFFLPCNDVIVKRPAPAPVISFGAVELF